MRRWSLSKSAAADLSNQIEYLKRQGAVGPALEMAERVERFLAGLCIRPLRRHIEERDLWEVWIPETKLVVWYRFDELELEVARFWHTSQNRQRAP